MTQDEIIEMAKQAGLSNPLWIENDYAIIEAFAKLVEAHTRGQIFKPDWDNYRQGLIDGATAEREACEKECQEQFDLAMSANEKAKLARDKNAYLNSAVGSRFCLLRIRARGEA